MINDLGKKILSVMLLGAVMFFVGYAFAGLVYAPKQFLNFGFLYNSEVKGASDPDISTGDLAFLNELEQMLRQNHLSDGEFPSSEDLVNGAAKGLVESVGDKYTNYYTAEEWQEMQADNSGQFEGIGIKLQKGEQFAVIESPIAGGPAESVGIMARDWIIEVDGESVEEMSLIEVADRIKGEKDTEVSIKVFRPSIGEKIDFVVKRSAIDLPSVQLIDLGEGQFHLEVSRFTEENMGEFNNQWDQAVDEMLAKGVNGVILDLRNNTGGWVTAAQHVLGEFLGEGVVMLKEVDKSGNENEKATTRAGKLVDVPLVVVVNEGSASASEIVAGALQDHGRALLVGKTTTGKGVEQIIETTSKGGKLFIVYKRWYTPNGRNLSSEEALDPDHEVELTTEDVMQGRDPQLQKARDLLK